MKITEQQINCKRCGKALELPESIARGMGHACETNVQKGIDKMEKNTKPYKKLYFEAEEKLSQKQREIIDLQNEIISLQRRLLDLPKIDALETVQ